MKFNQYILIVTVYFVSVIFQSCTENVILPDLKGNLVGYIYTFDEFSQPLSDHSGVTIQAIGNRETASTLSDKNGRFELENLSAGTYELHFLKSGFNTLKQFGIQHLGGEPTVLNMPFNPNYTYIAGNGFFIYELPTTPITSMQIENDVLSCELNFTKSEPDYLGIRLYFSLQDNFDPDSADYTIASLSMVKSGSSYKSYYSLGLPFKPGERVFFKACLWPHQVEIELFGRWLIQGIDSYFDYGINQMVYPPLGKESDQYSFIVPG
jgi:hypothetical protein